VQEAIATKLYAGLALVDCGHMPMDEPDALDAVAEVIRRHVRPRVLLDEKRLSA